MQSCRRKSDATFKVRRLTSIHRAFMFAPTKEKVLVAFMGTRCVFPYFKSQLKHADSFVKQLFKKLGFRHQGLCIKVTVY